MTGPSRLKQQSAATTPIVTVGAFVPRSERSGTGPSASDACNVNERYHPQRPVIADDSAFCHWGRGAHIVDYPLLQLRFLRLVTGYRASNNVYRFMLVVFIHEQMFDNLVLSTRSRPPATFGCFLVSLLSRWSGSL
jgi:hypothetical protein